MPLPHSADILPFPARTPPETPQARLAAALAALDDALAHQKQAVADWRGAIGALQSSVAGLGASLTTYRDTLGDLGTSVAGLNAEARALQASAEAMIASG